MKKTFLTLLVFLLPSIAFADPVADSNAAFQTAIAPILQLVIDPLILLLFAIALLYFLWGGVNFIRKGDNPKDRAEGEKHMIYGILGMGIMLSVFGIMQFIYTTVVTDTGGSSIQVGNSTFQTQPPPAIYHL